MSLERNPTLAFELELRQAAWDGSTGVISRPRSVISSIPPFPPSCLYEPLWDGDARGQKKSRKQRTKRCDRKAGQSNFWSRFVLVEVVLEEEAIDYLVFKNLLNGI